MADRAKKISELTALSNASGDDLLAIVDDPSGTPETKKITVANLFANVVSNTIFKNTLTVNGSVTIAGNSNFTKPAHFSNTVALTITAPASNSASGIAGEIRVDSSYIYVCVSNNSWKRVALSNF